MRSHLMRRERKGLSATDACGSRVGDYGQLVGVVRVPTRFGGASCDGRSQSSGRDARVPRRGHLLIVARVLLPRPRSRKKLMAVHNVAVLADDKDAIIQHGGSLTSAAAAQEIAATPPYVQRFRSAVLCVEVPHALGRVSLASPARASFSRGPIDAA